MSSRFKFSWSEFSGSLGDLGLFIPLVVAMATQGGLDLAVILIAAGAMNVLTGWLFNQPIPVQPMKAIAAVAITESLTRGELMASGLLMGGLLIVMAVSGSVDWLNRRIPKALVRGIQLGVGLKLAVKGLLWVSELPLLGYDSLLTAAVCVALLLLSRSRNQLGLVVVFVSGFGLMALMNTSVYSEVSLSWPRIDLGWPQPADWREGFLKGALPQLPLTLLNSVIAVCALSADYFPGRGIGPKRMAASVGLMNIISAPFGAIPMCHGAGGLAAQYTFGARTGGSVIMLGLLKITVGVIFGGALLGLLMAYPMAILGPLLIFAGVALARACRDLRSAPDRTIALATAAGILQINTFAGFLIGGALALVITIVSKRG